MNPQLAYTEFAECQFPADLRCVRLALEKIGDYCRARGLRPALWGQVELAIAEGLNNAVEHGCAGKPGAEVLLRWSWHQEMLTIEITDPGGYLPGPEPARLPEDLLAKGGRGAYLMGSLMDCVEHQLTDYGHLLRLRKNVGNPGWKPEEAAKMESTIESMAEDLSRSYEDLAALFHFAEELAVSTTLAEFLDRSLDRLLILVAGQAAFVRFVSEGGNALELIRPPLSPLDWLKESLPLDSEGIEVSAFKNGAAVTMEDCNSRPGDPLHSHVEGAFACPIFFRSTALGCLVVTRSIHLGYFSTGELGLIRVLADFLGIVRTANCFTGRD
ncbi:MAG: ATP-binding protein [Verrucomicrobiota bacterium]